jgi:hypothetical protein
MRQLLSSSAPLFSEVAASYAASKNAQLSRTLRKTHQAERSPFVSYDLVQQFQLSIGLELYIIAKFTARYQNGHLISHAPPIYKEA